MKKKKSLQEIEDFYVNSGYRGGRLREILKKDEGYQKLLRERKQKLTRQFKISSSEKKKYVLHSDDDFEILSKCNQLKKLGLTKEHGEIMNLIKTQLESDWRKPLMSYLNKLLKLYRK